MKCLLKIVVLVLIISAIGLTACEWAQAERATLHAPGAAGAQFKDSSPFVYFGGAMLVFVALSVPSTLFVLLIIRAHKRWASTIEEQDSAEEDTEGTQIL